MPRKKFNDGMEIIHSDFNEAAQAIEKELYDRIAYELGNRQTDFFYGDSFKVTYVNSTTVQVASGVGFQTDGTQVDPEPTKRLLLNAAAANKTIAAADPSNNRIDIVSVKAARATIDTENRNFKDAGTGVVSSVSFVVEDDWAADIVVTTGTPSGSPVAPSTPAGYIKIAEVTVTAATGVSGSSAVSDSRTRYKKPSSWRAVTSKTAAYTADLDDEAIYCDATSAGFTVTLPDASLCAGKSFFVMKTDSSANAITISPNANGASQTLDTQYTGLLVESNGTAYYIIG